MSMHLERMIVLLRDGLIPAVASDALLSSYPDGSQIFAEYLLSPARSNGRARPYLRFWILRSFRLETLVGNVLREIP